eukprot:jgi/Hompol1/6933/HPOL_001688-RA
MLCQVIGKLQISSLLDHSAAAVIERLVTQLQDLVTDSVSLTALKRLRTLLPSTDAGMHSVMESIAGLAI